ncbi:MAG TPA: helix-turn-helix domain-containing protein [Aestuariivirgaceae bacterium]|jgi:DNA-binding transcriptional ArsR family regulator|nr:helix-turn-helix domain-containing protein [Aestuariivirgaceae bacterium]
MSNTRHSQALKRRASIFAALGDQTRLTVLARLSAGEAQSIARLTAGSRLSRQAMTKHLGVLTRAGIVHSMRIGRENLFRLEPRAIIDARSYLEQVSAEWDDALNRLKLHVESGGSRE